MDAMTKMPWFRFYSEALTDRKIGMICRETKRPKVVVIGAWATILSLANDSPVRGILLISEKCPVAIEQIAYEFGVSVSKAQQIMDAFTSIGLTRYDMKAWAVTRWDERNPMSDSAAIRMKRYRERRKRDVTVTSPQPNSDALDVDVDVDKETYKAEAGADAPPAPSNETPPESKTQKAKPDDELLVDRTAGGLILLAEYEKLATEQGKKSRLKHYKNHRQRKAFEAVYGKLGTELATLINKGFAHERTGVSALLSWLEGCATRSGSGGNHAGTQHAQTHQSNSRAADNTPAPFDPTRPRITPPGRPK